MTWEYSQRTGSVKQNGAGIDTGYSGHGIGRNDSGMEGVENVGPIPRGSYSIGSPFTHGSKGPVVMRLTPKDHNALGRSGFLIHGDNSEMNFSASEGCIILKRTTRDVIAASGDVDLRVVT